jgi:predicted restriction endonuclease
LPIPELLRASHIVPWSQSVEHRLNPRNGLCLSATYDAAFDRGLIGFDDEFRLLIGTSLRERSTDDVVASVFIRREGVPMTMPEKNLPSLDLLRWHAATIFN